ncbi:MAG: hypothetical protein Pars2KO_22120 [Parasphingorhabdus sp.]
MAVFNAGLGRAKAAEGEPIYELSFPSVEDLQALAITGYTCVYLGETGRSGVFVFDRSDLSVEIENDPQQGIHIAPSIDRTGSSGAWVRQYDDRIHAKWFGVVADGKTDDTEALQSAAAIAKRKKQDLILPSGNLWISDTIKLATSTYGAGEDFTCFDAMTADFDVVIVEDTADFLELRGFRVQSLMGLSSGRGFVFERNNNNILIERLLAVRFGIGFDLAALNFVQAYRMLRADECTVGFSCDGRDTDNSGNGTSLTFQQCYANDCRIAFDIRYVSSASFIQAIVDVKSSTSTCIKTLGVGAVNVYDFHFEGTPGFDGGYFDFTTVGNLGSTLSIFGGYIDGADLTGRNFDVVRLAGHDDQVEINIHGLSSRKIVLDGNDAFCLKNSTGAIKLNIHGSIYPTWSVDSLGVSGSFLVRDHTKEDTVPISSGTQSIQSGENISTGLNKRPIGLVQINHDSVISGSIRPVITDRYSNGDMKIHFLDEKGAQVASVPFSVAWVAW